MNLCDMPISDFRAGVAAAKLCAAVRSPTAIADARAVILAFDGVVLNANLFVANLNIPGFLVIDTPSARYVAIEGTSTLIQGLGQVASYTNAPVRGTGGGISGYVRAAANNIINALQAYAGGRGGRKQLVAGHSYGGAVALAMAAQRYDASPREISKVATFGAPRTGDQSFANTAGALEIVRWLHEGDPVPVLPPTFLQAPLYYALLGPASLVNARAYQHADGGIGIFDDVTSAPAIGDTLPTPINEFDLAAWLTSWDNVIPSKHSLSTYIFLLQALADKYPAIAMNAESAMETIRPRGDFPSDPQSLGEVMVGDMETPRADVLPSQVTIDPSIAPSAPRYGKLNPVFFNATVVAYAGTRARARSLTRSLTKTLKGLTASIVVDTAALEKAFAVAINDLQNNPYLGSPPLNGIEPTTPVD